LVMAELQRLGEMLKGDSAEKQAAYNHLVESVVLHFEDAAGKGRRKRQISRGEIKLQVAEGAITAIPSTTCGVGRGGRMWIERFLTDVASIADVMRL
jgi:hypothetical protein